ncbi:MAG: restriction endonuclease subunit S [Neisseriaceae bacterium]|nr:restriction endonuclease subunit S [Neisseriaceae bacterium]
MEDNFKSNGGKFEEFRIGDLFDIRPTKNYGLTNNKLFATKGNIPVVVNSSMNNGVGGYVDLEPTEQGNIITFSDTTTADSIFYQPKPFVGYSHVQGMFPFLDNWNKGSLQYFVAMFRIITKGKFNYGTKFNRKLVREMKIQLPTQNGEIAFDYMEAYIKELEADRVKELEYEKAQQLKAYLIATGLKDYTLTAAEQTALEIFENFIKINNLTQMGGG